MEQALKIIKLMFFVIVDSPEKKTKPVNKPDMCARAQGQFSTLREINLFKLSGLMESIAPIM